MLKKVNEIMEFNNINITEPQSGQDYEVFIAEFFLHATVNW